MKYLTTIALIVFFSGVAFYSGRATVPQNFGGVSSNKQAVVTDLVESKARLKESTSPDTNVTLDEIVTALNDLKTVHHITQADLEAVGGDIHKALVEALGREAKLCDNPNSI